MNQDTNERTAAAVILGQAAAGVRKTLTPEERERRREAMRKINVKRAEGRKVVRVEGRPVPVEAPRPQAVLVTIRGR